MRWKKIASAALSFAVIVEMLVPVSVFAKPKIPSPTQVARELEQRYHVDPAAMQNMGEGFNVSANKKNVPEVSLFFSPTDPKVGEKISAKAFPVMFTNSDEDLYYTWYLKRKDCDIGPSGGKPAYCNADGVGGITVNDWKVAAARILATDGVEKSEFSPYSSDTDSDAYHAEFGGGNKKNTTDWCYLYNQATGALYELVDTVSNATVFSGCAAGQVPTCISENTYIDPGEINQNVNCSGGDCSVSNNGDTFEYDSTYSAVGSPDCSGGTPLCPAPTIARCVSSALQDGEFTFSQTSAPGSCSLESITADGCTHLFPWPDSNFDGSLAGAERDDAGDGSFGLKEEEFWGTNPKDPDTADNGSKDEANTVGLGQNVFEWNYEAGDKIGVVVEGTSMVTTKHDDSSYAVMWAWSRNNCSVSSTDSYRQMISGYLVNIPTIEMTDAKWDACFNDNLVDPMQGGQKTKLDISVSASPDNPMNDRTDEKSGDVVSATASVNNSSRPASELLYTWKVEMNTNTGAGFQDITAKLVTDGMLEASSGNGLDSIRFALNMDSNFLTTFGIPAITDPIYLRIGVVVKENFSSGIERNGKSDVIVRVSNTTKKIKAYSTAAALVAGKYQVSVSQAICNAPFHTAADFASCSAQPDPAACVKLYASENLDKTACRIVNDEIIGVEVDATGLADFSWTLNGIPLSCTSAVSASAACANGNQVFFATPGKAGETYTLQVNATDTTTGKSVTLARTFQIVDPEVILESADVNSIWPKYIGDYTAIDGTLFADYSENTFETYGTGNIKFKARFLPSFLGTLSSRSWNIDLTPVAESVPFEIDYAPAPAKTFGDLYNVSFSASLVQPEEKRAALRDIWGIEALESAEDIVMESVQIEVVEPELLATAGPKKFFAAVSTYLPSSILFSFKLIATMALLLFTVGFVFSLVPEAAPVAPRRRGNRVE